ncbi:uncharacterized protein N7529_011359 [Penicillium soppii]|uniref:uncharacterized protein n=1 Tax=Penicillium soppii TaxID=69789 RepID=UPI00254670CE|nr:uncharacterized protein N7529_011359 [Penicillium soppii]KAJ5851974.1 hypothetical protein N7529_011359 [Penicillium soppii]
MRLTIDTSNLSHASAASALAHANRKPVEIWHPPARQPAAEKAALCVKDFTPPQQPKPTTQHSAEGLGAALLAVREQNKASPKAPQPTHTRAISTGRYHHTAVGGHPKEKALQAATDAYSTSRKRADSVPSDQGIASDAPYARSAAGASQNVRHVEQDGPLDHLNSTMEASRIHHIANTNAKLYTSAPPVQAEIEEQNYKNSLRAAAISMAKDMYKVSDNKGSGVSDPALLAAQKGQSQLGYRKTVSTADGSAVRRAIALQEAAQKRAAEKLARMHDEHAEYQQYYGTAPQPQRSRLSRRKRTSSDADASQIDAEQSRQIRSQMTSLRTKLDQVDVRRTKDRELLMQAARRNVDQTLQDMEARVYANTGRAPPSVQREWDEVAQERVRREAEAFEAATVQGDRVKIGSQQYMDYADVEAVARSRLQPALDEITENAEQQRAHDIEERLDAEERQRHAAVLRQREAEVRELEKQDKSKNKSEGKVTVPKFFLWRKKGKRARVEQSETDQAHAVSPVAQEPAEELAETAAPEIAAPETDVSKDVIPEEASDSEAAGAALPIEVVPAAAPAAVAEPQDETRVPTEEIQEAAQEPTDEPTDDIPPAIPRRQSAPLHTQRDAAATGPTTIHHFTPPVSSPRADSKLKTWFRDRLARRSSGPVPVYPHQPGPDFTDSQPSFQGGAALTGRDEPRGTALSSHPINGSDPIPTHNRSSSYYSNEFDVTKTRSGESGSESLKNGNGNGKKRNRLRRTFLRTVSRSDDEPMNGTASGSGNERRDSEVPSAHSKGTDIQSLKNSALEQGLPAPPIIGENMSTRRESRFSEDL